MLNLDEDPDMMSFRLDGSSSERVRPSRPMVEPRLAAFADRVLAVANYPSSAEWHALADIAGPPVDIDAHIDLVASGGIASHLYILVDGWAFRARLTSEGGQSISTIYLPGDVINPSALIARESHETVHTLTQAQIVSIPLARLRSLKRNMPGLANMFLALVLAENDRLSQWLRCLGRQSATQRLAHLFCEWASRLDLESKDSEIRFDLPLSQTQIADIAGLTHIHVKGVLMALRQDGLIDARRGQLIIKNYARLQRLGDFDPAYLHGPGAAETNGEVRDHHVAGTIT